MTLDEGIIKQIDSALTENPSGVVEVGNGQMAFEVKLYLESRGVPSTLMEDQNRYHILYERGNQNA
jgi:hypothetical protein